METTKSRKLLKIARVLVGLSAVIGISALFVPPPAEFSGGWNPNQIFLVAFGVFNFAVLFFLYKKYRIFSGVVIILSYLYMVVDSVIYVFDGPYLLLVSCLLSPPLISGILLIRSGIIIKKVEAGVAKTANSG